MKVKLTVICMVYNHEKYLLDALEGFVSQKTNFKYKIVVHDDASTDNSQAIIKEYAEKYPEKIKPILQKVNTHTTIGGKERFRKYILPQIEGEYVAFCEGDDFWCNDNKLQNQVDYLDNHNEYTASVHNSVFLDMRTNSKSKFNNTHNSECDLDIEDLVNGVSGRYQTSSLVCRSKYIYERPSFFDKINVGDYPRAIQLVSEGKIRYFPELMSVYRFMSNPSSWTYNNTGLTNFNKRVNLIEKEIDMLDDVKKIYNKNIEVINSAINKKKYHKLFLLGKIKEIKGDEAYRAIYSNEKIIRKIKLRMRAIYMFLNRKKEK